jgi:hypothetical protein
MILNWRMKLIKSKNLHSFKMKKEINVKQSRFRDATWFSKAENLAVPIVIGGAGGIGSWLTLFLSRVLSSTTLIFLYDYDTVEEINMAGQLYCTDDIGKDKAVAISDMVIKYAGYGGIVVQKEKYIDKSLASPIMFSAFDNMEARKVMFKNWKSEAAGHDGDSIFIDGRLLAEQLQVFFVTPENAKVYEDIHLFDDSEVDDVSCSYKQTTHFAATIAGKMVQGFTNWLSKDVAELPFYYEEFGTLFMTTTTSNNITIAELK